MLNDSAGVVIEAFGEAPALDRFEKALHGSPPPAAHIALYSAVSIAPEGPGAFAMDLRPKSVAAFYRELMGGLQSRGIAVRIRPRPVEVVQAVPFEQDELHASYEPRHVELFWRGLVQADRVLKEFRTRFIGKASPVGFYWGSFDLSATRFSGRTAPRHRGGMPNCPDWVMVEACWSDSTMPTTAKPKAKTTNQTPATRQVQPLRNRLNRASRS